MVLGIADSIVGVAGKVLDKFVADKDLKAKLDFELRKAYADANLAQIDVNKAGAGHLITFNDTEIKKTELFYYLIGEFSGVDF